MRLCLTPCFAAAATASYTFLGLGDWGGEGLGSYHATDENLVAKQLGATAATNDAKFVLNTGDNFYYCGIVSDTDYQISEDYTKEFTDSALQVPWYSILGNHEYGYNVSAQVDFSNVDPTKRWIMPDRYWTKRIDLSTNTHHVTNNATGGVYMTILTMDTSPCMSDYRGSDKSKWDPCGSDFPTCSPIKEGPCKFNENILTQSCTDQFTWFKKQLAAVPKDDWLLVVGHAPADEIDVEDFTTAMQEHGFDLYMNGHVHTLQQYTVDSKGAYVTTGAGAMVKTQDQKEARCMLPTGVRTPAKALGHTVTSVFNDKIAGFTKHTFDATFSELTTEFVSYEGKVLHSFIVKKGAGPSPSPPSPPSPPTPPTPPSPGKCDHSTYPCSSGCTYIHERNERKCGVSMYGCYDCSTLKSGCPDCSGRVVV